MRHILRARKNPPRDHILGSILFAALFLAWPASLFAQGCSLPLRITKFEHIPNSSPESYRIEWRLDAQPPDCLSIDHYVVNYSVHASLPQEVTVPGHTFSAVVVYRGGQPSIAAAGRLGATVTGVVSSKFFGEVTGSSSSGGSSPNDRCNRIPMILVTARPPKLVEIKGSSSTGGLSSPGSPVLLKPPSAQIQSRITIHRGLQVSWQTRSQPPCVSIESFIVHAKVRLTDGTVQEGTITVGPDASSTIVPLLTETIISANQQTLEIQSVDEVSVHASTAATLNVKGAYKNF